MDEEAKWTARDLALLSRLRTWRDASPHAVERARTWVDERQAERDKKAPEEAAQYAGMSAIIPEGEDRDINAHVMARAELLRERFPWGEEEHEALARAERILYVAWYFHERRSGVLLVPFSRPVGQEGHERSLWWMLLDDSARSSWLDLADLAFDELSEADDRSGLNRTEAASRTRKKKRAAGRPRESDPEADRKLVADWIASGQPTHNDFERARRIEHGSVRKAMDREKWRRRSSPG